MVEQARPSVVVVVIDALRADCTPFADPGPYLRELHLSPPRLDTLTSLAAGMQCFTQAIACAPYTSAAHASLFTGLLPPEHGVRAFNSTALSRQVRTLAGVLVEAGYATCAMSDEPTILRCTGLLHGFQTIAKDESEALAWWDAWSGRPRLLFLHLWDVHKPYGLPKGPRTGEVLATAVAGWMSRLESERIAVPEAVRTSTVEQGFYPVILMETAWEEAVGLRRAMQRYIDGVVAFDRGRLAALSAALRQRSVAHDGILVISADHGEGRAAPFSNLLTHSSTLLDDQLRIPLYMHIPGLAAPAAVTGQASQADIAPTILDALGLLDQRTPPRSVHSGRSLLPLLRGHEHKERAVYAEMWSTPPGSGWGDNQQSFDPVLARRALRYPGRKYQLAGRMVTLDDDRISAPRPQFVRSLYRDCLGRPPVAAEVERWVAHLDAATGPEQARRAAVVQAFERSDEYRLMDKHAIYDLRTDPLERKPLDGRAMPELWRDFREHARIMDELDGAARAGEPLVQEGNDAQVIEDRLRALGYIE